MAPALQYGGERPYTLYTPFVCTAPKRSEPLTFMSQSSSAHPLWGALQRIAPYFTRHRPALLGVMLLGGTSACMSAIEPLVMKLLFDAFLAGGGYSKPLWPFAALVCMLASAELLHATRDRLVWRIRLGIDFSLMQATVERLHSLPLAYHKDQSVGATMTKIERGIAGCMAAFSEVVTRLFPALVYLSVSLVVMLRLEWRLSLAVIAFAPLPAVLGAWAAREQTAREKGLLERWTRVFSRFHEVLTGIVVVKSFVMEEQEKRRFLGGVSEANRMLLRGVERDTKISAAKNYLTASARLVALALGGLLVMRGEITLGTLVAFMSYLVGVFAPVQTLTGMYQTVRRASVSLDSVLSILDAQDSIGDGPDARDAGVIRGDVEFKNVSFRYRADHPVLQDISLQVRAGERIAFVGPSGGGKTTLTALLQRLYDPTGGSICIDGLDIRSYKQRSLRDQIGVVLQEGSLFSDTVRDNIAFGRPSATAAEIEAAARAANAHEFIIKLPQGYDTPVGERGERLSGGERKRIAIARALLKDAPILVLDEATTALDADSEEQVQQALSRLTAGRTTFVIAHQLSTITSADRIVVFRDGSIAELGTHDQLLRQNGYYASLVRKQMRGLFASSPAHELEREPRSEPAPHGELTDTSLADTADREAARAEPLESGPAPAPAEASLASGKKQLTSAA
jgi:ATP-binding cassette, subfamily B, bacterial